MLNKTFIVSIYIITFLVTLIYIFLLGIIFQNINFNDYSVNSAVLINAIKLSVITATISAIISMLISIPCGYCLSKKNFKFKEILETILYLPVIMSPIAIGAMLLIFFDSSIGKFIELHLIRFVFEKNGIVLAQIFVITGLGIQLSKQAFDNISTEYEYISYTLGYNKITTFYKTILPLAKKNIISTFLLIWARAIGEFGATLMLAGAITFKTETIPTSIFLQLESSNINNMMVLILVLFTISFSIILLTKKLVN